MQRSSFVNGTLGCFCDDQYNQVGWKAVNRKYSKSDSTRGPFSKICQDYLISRTFRDYFFTLSSVVTFLTNTVFILSIEPLLKSICSSNLLRERLMISAGLFICLICDSVGVPILTRSNFSEQINENSLLSYLLPLNGQNTDFGSNFYPDQACLLLINMAVLSLRPIINVACDSLVLKVRRAFKKNFLYRMHSNNYEDNIKFLELYAGPDYNFHTKSASLNVILFTTIVFGGAFPLLYAIALFAIVIQYINERFTLAKFYRLPPKFTTELPILNLLILSFGPLVSSALNFWMFGNQQLFGYSVDEKPR